jgi:phage virion morphogenesis protein
VIRIDGIADLRKAFDRLDALLRFPASMFRVLGFAVAEQARDRFDSKRTPDGEAWKPYAESTLKSKKARGVEPNLLQERGRLRKSFKNFPHRGRGEVGSPSLIAKWQQRGTKRRGKQHIPARPFLGIGREDLPELDDRLQEYVDIYFEKGLGR